MGFIDNVAHPRMDVFQLCERLNARGVKLLPVAQNTLRAVTHYPLEETDIREAVDAFTRILK